MIALFIIGSIFFGLAKKNEMNKIIWPAFGIGAYFLGQFVGVYFLNLKYPWGAPDMGTVYGYSLGGAIALVIVTWGIMMYAIKMRKSEDNIEKDSLLDDESVMDDTYLK